VERILLLAVIFKTISQFPIICVIFVPSYSQRIFCALV